VLPWIPWPPPSLPPPPSSPQELGAKLLKAALSCSDDTGFIRDHLLPFLKLLGCDALGRGTCKQPLIELVQTIYEVRKDSCTLCIAGGRMSRA
jgi:hypothetical protein